MTIRNLDRLFQPRTVALFGASVKKGSVGKTITDNLFRGGFAGSIWLVNPKYKNIGGQPCYKYARDLPEAPDLAVIATPPEVVPEIIAGLGEKGTKATVVITAGLRELNLTQNMLHSSQPYCLRIVGPNCLGVMIPGIGLNASFAHMMPLKGDLALLSQSGAIISAVLDWATGEGIGFSSIVSMGNMADVDLGDMLDYLAEDVKTHAILMYLEQVTNVRKFMSAARSAARVKPVVVIKSGRHAEAAKAAYSHTGALAGSDTIYNAAFHRAGILRVLDLEDLFNAAEALSRLKSISGERLAIITNGGGAGVLAIDRLIDYGGTLSKLSEQTIQKLNKVLPSNWSKENPIDIIGDAGPERYKEAMEVVLEDPDFDAVLVINCPTALASSTAAAKATISTINKYNQGRKNPKAILTAWLGDGVAREARELLSNNGYPTYETPADAVRGFTYLIRHSKDQRALMQTPPSLPEGFSTEPELAGKVMDQILSEGRNILTEIEAKTVLKAYRIPTVETVVAKTPAEVEATATEMIERGASDVAVKILSNDITHKSDVGGVALNLPNAEEAKNAALEMLAQIRNSNPEANIKGFTVQPMIHRPSANELIIGVSEDTTFGPVVMFGRGGTAVELINDTATALPPLDLKLAYDLMEETKVYRLLQGYRDRPAADINAIALSLVKISQMVAELPEIMELDINPLLADEKGVIALDARIVVKKQTSAQQSRLNPRFAIRPYPKQWENRETLPNGRTIMIRPIRPEDERYYDIFMKKSHPDDMRLRLFSPLRHLSHEFIARLTQIDYARAMAFIAIDPDVNEMVGVSRLASDPDYIRAEYAVIARSDMKSQGIGWALMKRLIDYAKEEGIQELWGQVLRENRGMLKMCRELGFQIEPDPDSSSLVIATLPLRKGG